LPAAQGKMKMVWKMENIAYDQGVVVGPARSLDKGERGCWHLPWKNLSVEKTSFQAMKCY
jgi:hypothetical protein